MIEERYHKGVPYIIELKGDTVHAYPHDKMKEFCESIGGYFMRHDLKSVILYLTIEEQKSVLIGRMEQDIEDVFNGVYDRKPSREIKGFVIE